MLFSPIARCFWLFLSTEGVGLADPLPIGFLKAVGLHEGLMLQPALSIPANDASQLSGAILGRLWHYFICAEISETDAPFPQLIKSLQLCMATMASVKRVK